MLRYLSIVQERWQAVENLVLKMRQAERIEIDKDVAARLNRYPVHYQYRSELVRVLQKGFYPLWGAKKLLLDVIPTLSHESDGLIFQVCSAALTEVVGNFSAVTLHASMVRERPCKALQSICQTAWALRAQEGYPYI